MPGGVLPQGLPAEAEAEAVPAAADVLARAGDLLSGVPLEPTSLLLLLLLLGVPLVPFVGGVLAENPKVNLGINDCCCC